ncbi:hypothetical protein [Pseudidiomarina insulisalsae]|uniref:Uncharacterized protein n=1 Tax=Pseudidiomarina insulisalsae TaxID=575789 RepID=A0A432YNT0_9GAMM|nr:hypothetical protein [Pseudidiomarina insulisalsae]RUO62604.1 hypothetical protein CWI71_04005 [Pseudidiomarina insulisalsae]
MSVWQRVPNLVKVCAAVVVLLCLLDFTQRVWISAEVDAREVSGFVTTGYQAPQPQVSDQVSAFIAQLTTAESETVEEESPEQSVAEQTPLIEGGVNLGDMRVRVRAIYVSQKMNKRVALIETQHMKERHLELTEIAVDDVLNNYKVSTITVDSVVFSGDDGSEPVVVPVFDY